MLTFLRLELEMGELVKDPHFTLFESVGALEVSNIRIIRIHERRLKEVDNGRQNG